MTFWSDLGERFEPNRVAPGSYAFAGATPGTWRIVFGGAERAWSEDQLVDTQLVPAGASELTFRIPLDAIRRRLAAARLRVVAVEDRRPLAKVRVSLAPPGTSTAGANTDSAGEVRIAGLAPGTLALELEAAGRERRQQLVTLESGEDRDLGDIPLAEAAEIAVTVVDAAGHPLSGGALRWTRLDGNTPADGEERWSYAVPGAGGAFRIPYAGRGRHLLVFESPGTGLAFDVADTTSGSVSGLRLYALTGIKVVHVVPAGCGAGMLVVRAPGGHPIWSRDVSGPGEYALLLNAGSYRAECRLGSGPWRAQSFDVGSDAVRLRWDR